MKYLIGLTLILFATSLHAGTHSTVPPANETMERALKYLHLHEKRNRKQLTKLLKIDPAKIPWCASFVNAILRDRGTGSLMARSFLKKGKKVKQPRYGDIVVLTRTKNKSKGHVGFFVRYTMNKDIVVLGGNQDNSVNFKVYSKHRLLGFRRY